jgi:hypothetical protein
MNHDKFKKFIDHLERIKMTKEEKNLMRNNLSIFILNPQPETSPYFKFLKGVGQKKLAFSLLLIFSFTFVTQHVAKKALPGDNLYGIKLVQEEITLATKPPGERKITYEIERTEKRIQEAAKLAQQDKLNETNQREIAQIINLQSERVQERIEKVKDTDPKQALVLNSELKSIIEINSQALRKVSTKKHIKKNDQAASKSDDLAVKKEDSTNSTSFSEPISVKEGEYEEISIAETLLFSIDENIKKIEKNEEEITQEIITPSPIKKEVLNPSSEISSQNENKAPEDISGLKENNNSKEEDAIYTLEKVVELKKLIQEIKKESMENHIHTKIETTETGDSLTVVIFDEETLRSQARILVEEGFYKESFILYEKIHQHLRGEEIALEVNKDLDIDSADSHLEIPLIVN